MVAIAQALDARIGIALLGDQRFEADFLVADHRLAATHLLIQRLPT